MASRGVSGSAGVPRERHGHRRNRAPPSGRGLHRPDARREPPPPDRGVAL